MDSLRRIVALILRLVARLFWLRRRIASWQEEQVNTLLHMVEAPQAGGSVDMPPADRAGPPAHWLARTRSPGPPAHWLEKVRQGAPHLLPPELRPKQSRTAPASPIFPSRRRATQPAGPEVAPEEPEAVEPASVAEEVLAQRSGRSIEDTPARFRVRVVEPGTDRPDFGRREAGESRQPPRFPLEEGPEQPEPEAEQDPLSGKSSLSAAPADFPEIDRPDDGPSRPADNRTQSEALSTPTFPEFSSGEGQSSGSDFSGPDTASERLPGDHAGAAFPVGKEATRSKTQASERMQRRESSEAPPPRRESRSSSDEAPLPFPPLYRRATRGKPAASGESPNWPELPELPAPPPRTVDETLRAWNHQARLDKEQRGD